MGTVDFCIGVKFAGKEGSLLVFFCRIDIPAPQLTIVIRVTFTRAIGAKMLFMGHAFRTIFCMLVLPFIEECDQSFMS